MKNQVEINKTRNISVEITNDSILLDHKKIDFDVKSINPNQFLVYQNDKIFEIDILENTADFYKLKIDGVIMDAEVINHQKQLLKDLGMGDLEEDIIDEIKSPMPGTILEIICKKGQTVVKGDPLIILEAMKMENIIKSPTSGIIQEIKVEIGQSVEKNQSLVVF